MSLLSAELHHALARAARSMGALAEREAARHGLTGTELAALQILHQSGPLLLGQLQRRVHVSSGGMTYLANRLAARGLVRRLRCPGDRRARRAALTATGRKLVERAGPAHARAVAAPAAGMAAADVASLIAALRRLADAAERGLDEAEAA